MSFYFHVNFYVLSIVYFFNIFSQRNKAPNEQTIPLLMPQQHMVIPHYMGNRELNPQSDKENAIPQDVKKECSFYSYQDIPLLLPHEPDSHSAKSGDAKIYGLDRIYGNSEHSNRTNHSHMLSLQKTKIEHSVQDMQMKNFVDNLNYPKAHTQNEEKYSLIKQPTIQKVEWWETQEQGSQVVSTNESRQVGPRIACHCQVGINDCQKMDNYHLFLFTMNHS